MPRILSEPTEKLLAEIERHEAEKLTPPLLAEEVISVSDITRGLGFLYEKIRNTLDYKEEALWAKNATWRALRRRLTAFLSGDKVGQSIIEELIRGRYLENNALPESKAAGVDNILTKYRLLFNYISEKGVWREDESLENWILQLVSSEIEEVLRKSGEDRKYISFMYEAMKSHLKVSPEFRSEDLDLQIYLASYRALLQADRGMETYIVFRLLEPDWPGANKSLIQEIGERLPETRRRIDKLLNQSIRKKLDQILKSRSILIHLLRDILTANPERAREILQDPEELESVLHDFYDRRYRENRARLQRTAARAVIFIFVTKMLLALTAEVPYEILRTGQFNLLALGINTFLPPLILIGAAIAIRMPGEEKNFVKLVMDFETLISAEEEPTPLDSVKPPRARSFFTKISIAVLYIANFALTFSLLFWFLRALKFNWLSAVVFIFFLSLVGFFALRLRRTANELAAVEERESYGRAAIDFLAFPIVELGRLLARGLASINIVSFVFDFFIEAPFHAFVAILEEWITFMKERKKAM